MIFLVAFSFAGCYEKFDPTTYAPEFIISGFTAADQIQPSSLIAYWPFDGNLNETVSGNAANNSGTGFTNGLKGQALDLNVANKSYITYDAPPSITGVQSFTVSFWVNPTFVDANGDDGIDGILGLINLSKPDGFWGNLDWFVENNNPGDVHSNNEHAAIRVHVQGGTTDTWVEINNYKGLFGTWSNHTLTYDATTSEFQYYINGSTTATTTSSWGGAIAFTGSGPMVFGTVQFQTEDGGIGCCGNQSWASYLTGSLDEVRIYNIALSAIEVSALVVLQGKGK